MYARVARWEGAEADALRSTAERIRTEAASGRPRASPGNAFQLLIDPDAGRVLAIAFFETEDDLRVGNEALNAMSPPGEGLGSRTSVEMYEVAVDAGV